MNAPRLPPGFDEAMRRADRISAAGTSWALAGITLVVLCILVLLYTGHPLAGSLRPALNYDRSDTTAFIIASAYVAGLVCALIGACLMVTAATIRELKLRQIRN